MLFTAEKSHLHLTLVFVDLCNSTRLYEQLGDDAAQHKVRLTLDALRHRASMHDGRLIKEIGDESMLVFHHTDDALNFAAELPHLEYELGVRFKTGIHSGEVIAEQNDIYGDAVNTAARIVSLACSGQMLISKESLDALEQMPPLCRELPPVVVKGKQTALRLCELLDQQAPEHTQVIDPASLEALTTAPRLKLSAMGLSWTLDAKEGDVSVGRDPSCTVQVPLPQISRIHLRIEPRGSHWWLHDQSTNGTLIQEQGSQTIILRRESTRLLLTGLLHLAPGHPEHHDMTRFSYELQHNY